MTSIRRLLSALLSLGLYSTAQSTDYTAPLPNVTYPQTISVSLVFPRNETYIASPMFPLIFAVDNPSAVPKNADLSVGWTARRSGDDPDAKDLPFGVSFESLNYWYWHYPIRQNGSDEPAPADLNPKTYYYGTYTSKFTREMAGHWTFYWLAGAYSCEVNITESNWNVSTPAAELFRSQRMRPVEFTIIDQDVDSSTTDARDPTDFAATQADTCANWPGVAWEIIGVMPVYYGNILVNYCPVMPEPSERYYVNWDWDKPYDNSTETSTTATGQPTSTIPFNPCLITMDATAVSSVQAVLSTLGCEVNTQNTENPLPDDVCSTLFKAVPTGPVESSNADPAAPFDSGNTAPTGPADSGGMGMAGVAAWSLAWMIAGGLMLASW
ncbi:hypothetical protein VTJ04DRAFT_9152 [Mycothermus thermophilus]|uniref:uncharacterized protein n=1 Tax=Humicola insolens TaxID=85995 RepID=UPI0037435677